MHLSRTSKYAPDGNLYGHFYPLGHPDQEVSLGDGSKVGLQDNRKIIDLLPQIAKK